MSNAPTQPDRPVYTCLACKWWLYPEHCRHSDSITLAQRWGYTGYEVFGPPWRGIDARAEDGGCGPTGELWEYCGRFEWRMRKLSGDGDLLPEAWLEAKGVECAPYTRFGELSPRTGAVLGFLIDWVRSPYTNVRQRSWSENRWDRVFLNVMILFWLALAYAIWFGSAALISRFPWQAVAIILLLCLILFELLYKGRRGRSTANRLLRFLVAIIVFALSAGCLLSGKHYFWQSIVALFVLGSIYKSHNPSYVYRKQNKTE